MHLAIWLLKFLCIAKYLEACIGVTSPNLYFKDLAITLIIPMHSYIVKMLISIMFVKNSGTLVADTPPVPASEKYTVYFMNILPSLSLSPKPAA